MPNYDFLTNLLANAADNDPKLVDPFRDNLQLVSGNEIGQAPILVDPLTYLGSSGSALVDAIADTDGVPPGYGASAKFGYGSGNRFPTAGNPFLFAHVFGLEVVEFCSWWYEGSPGLGAEIAALHGLGPGPYAGKDSGFAFMHQMMADYAPNPSAGGKNWKNLVFHPINVAPGESGGWYKEALTLKKLQDGKYASGEQLKFRYADEPQLILKRAFPKVETPPPVLSGSWLQDAINHIFNGGEYSSPLGDASTSNGMFPNYPDGAGGIIEAGLKHYYIQTWATPFRGRFLFIQKDWLESLPTQQQAMIYLAATQCHMNNVAYQLQGQDAFIKRFQELGGTIHEKLPADVLAALRQATDEIYKEEYGGLGVEYAAVRDHQRSFIRKNQVRWRSGNLNRRWRFNARIPYMADLQPNVKL